MDLPIVSKLKKLFEPSLFGFLVYVGLNFMMGLVHYFSGTLKFNVTDQTLFPTFWETIYYSFVPSAVFENGTILAYTSLSRLFVAIHAFLNILFLGILGGYMAYLWSQRPDNLLFTKSIYLRPFTKDVVFALRLGNKGEELMSTKLEISFLSIQNNMKSTDYKYEKAYTILERSWRPTINLTKHENADFLKALKKFYKNPDSSLVRVMVTGIDSETGVSIAKFKYYKNNDLKIAGEFKDINQWENLQRGPMDWSMFDQTEVISEEEEQRVRNFLNS
ncbi:MAG: hypothetical protein KA536_10290 [Saprospiraceae bacterium]|nr:hypothetical protein [Saprospiraceae bacterium]